MLAIADETKRTLRQRISAALDAATGKDAATRSEEAAIAIFRTFDPEAVRRAALAFLVGLASDDARFKAGVAVGRAPRKPKSHAPLGGKQNLTKPMPKGTRCAGENFTVGHGTQARYAEWLARAHADDDLPAQALVALCSAWLSAIEAERQDQDWRHLCGADD